jgi:hypothetical protein
VDPEDLQEVILALFSHWGTAAGHVLPGAGKYETTNHGSSYGSPLIIPLIGGSGGGALYDSISAYGGDGGGGAILIASNTRILCQGTISATCPSRDAGRYWNWGFGSGGAIRLIAPNVEGAGTLNVQGGINSYYGNRQGGPGRIRIDRLDRHPIALNLLPTASCSVGANMVVFPPNPPRLDITQAAGNNIPVGTNSAVFFMLPQGSSTNQTVTVQASNFGKLVPIRVVLTPDNGPSVSFDAEIDNSANNNPASVTVPVVIPVVNTRVQVNAWTR